MSSLYKEKIIIALQKLSAFMMKPDSDFKLVIDSANHSNAWFTTQEIEKALISLSKMLNDKNLKTEQND